ncbi:YfhO family protein [Patescibacteria group bacterium]
MEFVRKYKLYIFVLLTILILTIIFFPKVFLKGEYLSTADFVFIWEPWNSVIQRSASNYVLSDVVTSWYPALQHFFEQIKTGEFPLWYNTTGLGSACGAGIFTYILTNPILFFFMLITNFSDIGLASTASIIFLILFRGLFTFLLLRRFSLSKFSSLLGAVIFSFNLYNIVWSLGSLVYVTSMIPFTLWTIEGIFQKASKKNIILFIVGCSLLILAGFPSTIAYVLFMLVLYTISKSLYLLFKKEEDIKAILKRLSIFLISGIISIGITAFTILPSFEYFSNSIDLSYRGSSHSRRYLPYQYFLRIFVPDVLGNPIDYSWQQPPFQPNPSTNYNESAMYVGLFSLFLALLSVIYLKKKKKVIFFWTITIFSGLIIYKVGPFLELINNLPIFSSNPSTRLLILVSFSLTILAAFGLNAIEEIYNKRIKAHKLFIPITTIVFLNIFAAIIYTILRITNGFTGIDLRLTIEIFIALGILFNCFALLVLTLTRKLSIKLFSIALIAITFLDLYKVGRNYIPTVERDLFYPMTEGISLLQDEYQKTQHRILPFDEIFLFGGPVYYNMNSITLATHYDKRWVEMINYIQPESIGLRRESVRFKKDQIILSNQLIDLLGVKYIIDHKGALPLHKKPIAEVKDFNHLQEITSNDVLSQTFKIESTKEINGIGFRIGEIEYLDDISFTLEIQNTDTEEIIKEFSFNTKELELGLHIEESLEEPILTLNEGNYSLNFKWEDTTHNSISLRDVNKDFYEKGELVVNGIETKSDLTFLIYENSPTLNDKYQNVYDAEVKIYENKEVFDRTFLLHDIRVVYNDEDSLTLLKELENKKELNSTAIIENPSTEMSLSECKDLSIDSSEITSYRANTVTVKTNSNCDSILVLTDLYHSNWKVYVDGKESELLHVDYLVRGVQLTDGKHNIEFKYESKSFVWGVTISIASLLGVVIFTLPLKKYTLFKRKKN